MARAPGYLAGGEMCEGRRAIEPGCSARPDCLTPPMCSRQDSGRPLYLWAGHRWTLTGPEKVFAKGGGKRDKNENMTLKRRI